jgi:PAT family beta-lactamase induction signal transducer AmpG
MRRETIIQAYFNRRMAVLLGIGFAAGLPSVYRLLGSTLQAWLIDAGHDVGTIGLFSLVGLPFAFNFAWAPFLDRWQPPLFRSLGRRRGWLLLIQLAIVAAIIAMAMIGPGELWMFGCAGLVVAFMVASHDVVADAYRTDVLPEAELGAGAAVYVNGYRLGMVVASAGALALSEYLPWRVVYLILAAMMTLGMAATWFAPTPLNDDVRPATLVEALVLPVGEFFARLRWWGVAVLAFIVLFKLPDGMANAMTMPLLQQELAFDKMDIAKLREGLGLVVLILGAFAGGALTARLGLIRSLWMLVVLQAASNLGFCALATIGPSKAALIVVVTIENFCQGMVTAGFIAFLMSQCNRKYSATQYALFGSLNYLSTSLVGAVTGYLVQSVGYVTFFALTVAAALPAVVLLILVQLGGVHRPRDQAV